MSFPTSPSQVSSLVVMDQAYATQNHYCEPSRSDTIPSCSAMHSDSETTFVSSSGQSPWHGTWLRTLAWTHMHSHDNHTRTTQQVISNSTLSQDHSQKGKESLNTCSYTKHLVQSQCSPSLRFRLSKVNAQRLKSRMAIDWARMASARMVALLSQRLYIY